MAAVLYGEGAMSIAYILLEYGAGVLQSSTADYGVIFVAGTNLFTLNCIRLGAEFVELFKSESRLHGRGG
jgi:hypothetical protein